MKPLNQLTQEHLPSEVGTSPFDDTHLQTSIIHHPSPNCLALCQSITPSFRYFWKSQSTKNTSNLHRVGRAGRGMNRERAPGVNRQTAGNLARQPPKGAVCKVPCLMNGLQSNLALPILLKAKLSAWRFTGPCLDFRCLARVGRLPSRKRSGYPLIFGTFHQGKVQEQVSSAMLAADAKTLLKCANRSFKAIPKGRRPYPTITPGFIRGCQVVVRYKTL